MSADKRDHAEGAAVIATILHLEVGAGALVGGIENRRGQQFRVSKNVGDKDWAFRICLTHAFVQGHGFSRAVGRGTRSELT